MLQTSSSIATWFALAVHKTRNMVIVADREDRVVWVNEAFERGTGYSLDEVRGCRPAEFLQGIGTEPVARDQIETAVRERREFEGEIYNYRRDGSGYWVWLSITPLSDEAGAFAGFVTIQTDITKRKDLENELAKFRLAIQKSQALVVLTDRDDHIEWVNERFVEVTGYTFEEVRGRRPADLLRGPDTDPEVAREVDASADEHTSFEGEILNYRKDGTGFWVSVSGTPIYDTAGEFQGYIGIQVDTTERRMLEAEMARLKDAEIARLDLAMRKSRNSVMITDPEDRVEWVNEGFTRLTGYGLEEVRGRLPKDFMPGAETDAEMVRRVGEAVRTRQTFEGEIYNYRRDGTGYWAWISTTPLYVEGEEGERFRGFITIHVDVTDRKRLEAELAETIEQLRVSQRAALESERRAMEASRAKSAFLANMSHELRTPINGILGMNGLLLETDLSDEQRSYAEATQSCARNLLTIINDILDISKIEAGKIDVEHMAFDLRREIDQIARMIRPQAAARHLVFEVVYDDAPAWVVGDALRIRQVLLNLVANAVKFTEEGEVVLRVSSRRSDGESVDLAFVVRDTGIGIPASKLEHIFEPFTQADGSTTRKYGGTGLGLTISRQLAQLMGGRIDASSVPGVGSTFTFVVPVGLTTGVAESAGESDVDRSRVLPLLANLRSLESDVGRGEVADLVAIFLADVGDRVRSLRAAAKAGALAEMREYAHRVRGSCVTLGASAAAAAAARIEDQDADAVARDTQGLVDDLDREFERVRAALSAEYFR
jgi:PAS domain S-box-containing protein